MENLRRILNLTSHVEPMPEIIAHVVTTKGKHGHGIAPGDSHGAGGSSRSFRGKSRADKYAVLPVARLIYQRGDMRPPAAEDNRGYRYAFGIFPMGRNRRRLSGRDRVARIRLRRGPHARIPFFAFPVDQFLRRSSID